MRFQENKWTRFGNVDWSKKLHCIFVNFLVKSINLFFLTANWLLVIKSHCTIAFSYIFWVKILLQLCNSVFPHLYTYCFHIFLHYYNINITFTTIKHKTKFSINLLIKISKKFDSALEGNLCIIDFLMIINTQLLI